jgi:hypothetical protein
VDIAARKKLNTENTETRCDLRVNSHLPPTASMHSAASKKLNTEDTETRRDLRVNSGITQRAQRA